MKTKQFAEAMSELEEKYVAEALIYKKSARQSARGRWCAAAACFALAAVLLAVSILSPLGSMSVTAYAAGTDAEITSAGAAFATGTIHDDGTLDGYPLMFYLKGSGIDTVRFSCKNGQLCFTDLTGRRDAYDFAQNFTVPYGANAGDEADYPSLLIEWLPRPMMEALADADIGIADLAADLRQDIIVLEITFANGRTATRAVTIDLQDDGSFRAAFRAYRTAMRFCRWETGTSPTTLTASRFRLTGRRPMPCRCSSPRRVRKRPSRWTFCAPMRSARKMWRSSPPMRCIGAV